MRVLLDTHVLLWAAADQLPAPLEDVADQIFVSAATIWEVEIKRATGKLRAPEDLADRVAGAGFDRLAITFEHAVEAGRLPRRHDDPFDRMLVAQARLEGLILATADPAIRQYDVPVLDVARA